MANRSENFAAGSSVTAYHITAKSNRASIEKNGLVPGEPWNGKKNRVGVFGSVKPELAERYARDGYADNRPGSDSEGNMITHEGPHEGGDVWEFTAPAGKVVNDTWTKPSGSAIRHPEPVPASNVKRVGHVTGNDELHWSPEESCTQCKGNK